MASARAHLARAVIALDGIIEADEAAQVERYYAKKRRIFNPLADAKASAEPLLNMSFAVRYARDKSQPNLQMCLLTSAHR